MTVKKALQLLEAALEAKTGKHLTHVEKEILKAAQNNETYHQVADCLYLSVGYIKDLAYPLWQHLSDLFGQKVTKNNFAKILQDQSAIATLTPKKIETSDIEQNWDSKGNILIVDDDPIENLRVLTEILTKQGYKVSSVTNAQMVLSTIRHNSPDVILLGVKIPEVDSYQIYKTLKADEYTAEIPIIFLSPLNETIDKIKPFEMRGLDYTIKPFNPEEVIARIQIQLAIQQEKHQLREKIEQHQQSAEILYQSRALLASVLNSSQDGIAAMQAVRNTTTGEINDFCCLVINPVFAKLFGQKREDLMGKSGLKKLLNQLYPRLFDSLLQLGETRESVEQEFYWSNDEIAKWYYLIAVKLGDGCSITVRDITEVKQLKFKLNLKANLA